MTLYRDYQDRQIRLPDERLAHVLRRHPYLLGMESTIQGTLEAPGEVRRSNTEPGSIILYYRRYADTIVGNKYMCVVVKMLGNDAFILTAYMTDVIKEGDVIWLAAR